MLFWDDIQLRKKYYYKKVQNFWNNECKKLNGSLCPMYIG